ncbi:hypothetical protein BN11_650032 [Nostocoides australiense Ben110]|uniref:Uncharacterized protein n=1 Tax=Nostocoides australiense Ben110 TaxID=1193182 RepID=W6K4P2_9MICO|nr:hypothetical protein BN11_650032 [Tetrasphaera australiensis Ben110]
MPPRGPSWVCRYSAVTLQRVIAAADVRVDADVIALKALIQRGADGWWRERPGLQRGG